MLDPFMYAFRTLLLLNNYKVRVRVSGKDSTCQAGDVGSIPGSGRSPGEGNGNLSSILAWEIPWKEEPGELWSMGLQRVGHG